MTHTTHARTAGLRLIFFFTFLILTSTVNADRAFLYSDGVMTDLGTLGGTGGTESVATGINDNGQVVGRSRLANAANRAFLYSDGVMTDLGTLDGGGSYANGINNSGQVVGSSLNHAFLYSDGVMTDLGTLPGGTFSGALGINDSGQVVGSSTYIAGSFENHAFLYSDGVMTDLNTLLAPGSSWILETASGINDLSQIAGTGSIDGQTHAFLYDSGLVTDLGTLGGSDGSAATGINDNGQVVGYSSFPYPVPVPPALWLFGSGLVGLLGIAKRRKR